MAARSWPPSGDTYYAYAIETIIGPPEEVGLEAAMVLGECHAWACAYVRRAIDQPLCVKLLGW
jgi:hypothetical protein